MRYILTDCLLLPIVWEWAREQVVVNLETAQLLEVSNVAWQTSLEFVAREDNFLRADQVADRLGQLSCQFIVLKHQEIERGHVTNDIWNGSRKAIAREIQFGQIVERLELACRANERTMKKG